TVATLRVEGVYAGAAETLVLTGGAASACATNSTSSMRPICTVAGSTFTAPAVVRYTTTGAAGWPDTISFNTLQLRPASGSPTYTLADASTDSVTVATLDVGTGASAMTARIVAGELRVTGGATVNALATYSAGGGHLRHEGNLTGAGTVASSGAGTVQMRPPGGAVVQFGSTSGSNVWSIELLEIQNSGSTASTVRLAAGGTGAIVVTDTLDVGLATDLGRVTLDAETNDRALDVRTFFNMSSMGTYAASSTTPLTVGKDFDVDTGSQFQANAGTVSFNSAAFVSRLTTGSSALTFFNLTSVTPAKVLRVDPTNQINTTNLTVTGGSCGTRAGLASNVEGTRFRLNVTGTSSIQYADVIDSEAIAPLTATNSTSGGNNLGWTVTGSCSTVTVSGTAYADQVGTVWSGCDGVTPNIAMSVNGYGKRTTTCSPATGAYAFTPVPDPGLLITVFMDTGDATPGVTYTVAPATVTSLAGLDVTYARVRLRSETAAPMTSRLIAMYDSEGDQSVMADVSEFVEDLTVPTTMEVIIEAGDTYQPEEDVSTGSMEVQGTYHQTNDVIGLRHRAGGLSSDCNLGAGVQMPLCVGPAGVVDTDGGNGDIIFSSPAPMKIASTTYPSLLIEPTASNPAITLGHAPGTTILVEGSFEVGFISSGISSTVETSTYSPTVNIVGGISDVGELDVELGNTLTGTSDFTVTSDILDSGTINMTGGTIEQRVATSEDTGPAGAGNHTYYNIVYSNSSDAPVVVDTQSIGAGTITVTNTMQVGRPTDTATTSFVDGNDNETIDINGSLLISSKGAFTAADLPATQFSIGDDFTNQGSFTASGGRVTFDDASKISSIATSAPMTFTNLLSTTPGETLRFQNAMTTTVTGTFTANGGSCGSPVALESTSAGSPWTINAGTAAVQYVTLRDSTAAPARTATSAGNLGGNTGWTFSGGCAAPTTMLSHDTNAAGSGVAQNPGIIVDTPHVSWINNSGLAADRQRTQFVNTPVDATVSALWHLDGSGADVAGGGGGSIASFAAPNDASWDAVGAQAGYGQVLDVDGDDVASAPSHSSSIDLDTFTVEAWVRLDALTGAIGNDAVIVEKRSAADATNFRLAVRRTSATAGVVTADVSTGGAGVTLPAALVGTTNLNDGRWHHVALVVNSAPADPSKVQEVYVDGTLEGTSTFSGNVDNPAVAVTLGGSSALGEFLDGRIDEVRISAVARTAGELRGYVRTRMPHGTELWDSDPTDAGIVVTPNCANLARCVDVTYAGAPLVRDGARYYVRGKLRSTTSIWSGWSTWDWFQTVSSLTIGVSSGASATFTTAAMPGQDLTTTSTVTVSTNDRSGYALSAKGPDDSWGLDGPGAAVLPRWSGAPDAPTLWAPGVSGAFGLTVLSATGGKDTATWGSGSSKDDLTNLRYVGLQLSNAAVLHRRTTYSAGTDSITTSYRANVDPTQVSGTYVATVTYTAVPNV
ncbi:MAG: siaA, partial [Thermoleophilia bacterium]|nr:siaA [Thermoleophilia bacterium]